MANRYVRLYSSPDPQDKSTIIGFSRSASDVEVATNEAWSNYFADKGYTARELLDDEADIKKLRSLGGVSCRYFEIKPPISEVDISGVAKLCMEQVDPYHNDALLIDNRTTPSPFWPFDSRGQRLARW